MDYDWDEYGSDQTEARRRMIAKTIREIGIDELRALGGKLFRYSDDPWRIAFFAFLDESPGGTIYHAEAGGEAEVIFCPSENKGFWYIPGKGMGPLQARALKVLAEVAGNL